MRSFLRNNFLPVARFLETLSSGFQALRPANIQANSNLKTGQAFAQTEKFRPALEYGFGAAITAHDPDLKEDALWLCRWIVNGALEDVRVNGRLDRSDFLTFKSLVVRVGNGRASFSERIKGYQAILPLVRKAYPSEHNFDA
jgi:hypothetical protein